MAKHGKPRSRGTAPRPKPQPMYTPSYWIDALLGDGRKKQPSNRPARPTSTGMTRRKKSF